MGGLKKAFRVKILVFVSTETLQTVEEGKKVVEKDACGGVCSCTVRETQSSLG